MTILAAKNITKNFPGVLANDNVNFSLDKPEIHVLLGENGAGKTTLMNIIYGLEIPDRGEIIVNGEQVIFNSPNDAICRGIGMVHQHFMLVPVFTVMENIILGVEETKKKSKWLGNLGILDRKNPEKKIIELAESLSLNINPKSLVGELPVGIQQKVEIIKALYRGAQVLILDEPTAVLTPQEVKELFGVMRNLTRQGMGVILITHKLKEVMEIADRISVMRQGKMIATCTHESTNEEMLAEMMVGRKVILQVDKTPAVLGEKVLQVDNLSVKNDRHNLVVNQVNFTVYGGEIFGIAGVQGNGQQELVEAIMGLRDVNGGNISILGKNTTNKTTREIIETGVVYVPEDREKYGLVGEYSVQDNLVLCSYYQSPFAKGIVLQSEAIAANARQLVQEFDVRPPDINYAAGTLSGGNKQKVIIARELSRNGKLLIACQPTRGVDVGSIEFIHKRIVAARDAGMAIVLISAELDEILALCDRVAVMFKGNFLNILSITEVNREKLGLLMGGVN